MKKIIFSILIAVMVISFSLNLESASKRKRVAVFDFDFAAAQKWWEGNWDIDKGIADILVTNLVEDGTYSVIERKALDKILAEQDFSTSDRADSTTAAKIGKVLGVDYIIIGSITTFGTDTQKIGVGGGGGVGIDMTSSDFRETILGEATEAAVTQVKDKFVQAYSKLE